MYTDSLLFCLGYKAEKLKIRLSDQLVMLYPIWILLLTATSPIEKKAYFILPLFFMITLFLYNQYIIKSQFSFSNPYKFAEYNIKLDFKWVLLAFILLMLVTNDMITYYTGSDIYQSLQNILNGDSNYSSYQEFFRENERSTFEPIKIYYNIILAILKISAFFSIYMIFFLKKRTKRYYLLLLPLVSYAITRGTNIEFFDIFLYTSIVFIVKYKASNINLKIKLTRNLSILFIVFISMFFYQIQSRYSFEYQVPACNYDFCYNKSYPFGSIGALLYSITPYFLGGLINLYVYFSDITFSYFLPFNSAITGHNAYEACSESTIVCGPWKPMIISFVESIGLIFTIALYTIIPFLMRSINRKIKNQFIHSLVLYLYLYFLVSGFMGGGISSSFSNLVLVFFIIVLYFKSKMNVVIRKSK